MFFDDGKQPDFGLISILQHGLSGITVAVGEVVVVVLDTIGKKSK